MDDEDDQKRRRYKYNVVIRKGLLWLVIVVCPMSTVWFFRLILEND